MRECGLKDGGTQPEPVPAHDVEKPPHQGIEQNEIKLHRNWYGIYQGMVVPWYRAMSELLPSLKGLGKKIKGWQDCRKESAQSNNYYADHIENAKTGVIKEEGIKKSIDQHNPDTENQVEQVEGQKGDDLSGIAGRFLTLRNNFKIFREQHDLNRYPSYDTILSAVIMMIIFALGEGVANAWFYFEAAEKGLFRECGDGIFSIFIYMYHWIFHRLLFYLEKILRRSQAIKYGLFHSV